MSSSKALPRTPNGDEKKAISSSTLLWDEIPQWLQDNHYIRSGYRPLSGSYWISFLSIGYLHNESVNIWTHLLGAILAALAAVILHNSVRPRFHMATREDMMVFGCYFGGAIACLGMSATYHTISNHSASVAKFGNRLDYIGIVFLIWGSFIPSIYYGFSTEPALVRRYWTMVSPRVRAKREYDGMKLMSCSPDKHHWSGYVCCRAVPKNPVSRVAASSCDHVRRYGLKRSGSGASWPANVRLPAARETNRSLLARRSRRSVRGWSCDLCGT